jgi:hypothetical protein
VAPATTGGRTKIPPDVPSSEPEAAQLRRACPRVQIFHPLLEQEQEE